MRWAFVVSGEKAPRAGTCPKGRRACNLESLANRTYIVVLVSRIIGKPAIPEVYVVDKPSITPDDR